MLIIKTESGERFALNDELMIHTNPGGRGFYVAERSAIKAALGGVGVVEYGVFYMPMNLAFSVTKGIGNVTVGYREVQIGCQRFTGANAKALKKWAKSYKPQS